jgi:hypothetical protein
MWALVGAVAWLIVSIGFRQLTKLSEYTRGLNQTFEITVSVLVALVVSYWTGQLILALVEVPREDEHIQKWRRLAEGFAFSQDPGPLMQFQNVSSAFTLEQRLLHGRSSSEIGELIRLSDEAGDGLLKHPTESKRLPERFLNMNGASREVWFERIIAIPAENDMERLGNFAAKSAGLCRHLAAVHIERQQV